MHNRKNLNKKYFFYSVSIYFSNILVELFFTAMVPSLVFYQSQIFSSRIKIQLKLLFQNSWVRMPRKCRVKGCKSLTGLYKAKSENQRAIWKEAISFTGKGNNKDKLSTETDRKKNDQIMTQKDTIQWFSKIIF